MAKEKHPPTSFVMRHPRAALAAIVLVALVSRTARLNAPGERFFDEVYHAYTAEQWVEGNTDAWLWQTHAPEEGCSYEWTHPPLAKLMMQWSMEAFGVAPWAWRLPAALLGTVCVLLVYALARTLFRSEHIALLAGALAALDTLPLTLSRVGMNDVYCTAFILTAVLCAARKRIVLAPLAAGLALACKWTALYALPLLAFVHLVRTPSAARWKARTLFVPALWYAVLVPAVYVASYTPFFVAGNSAGDLMQLHEQMWYYHTQLEASHPYSSPAWNWPLGRRTVWCYTKSIPEAVAPDAAEDTAKSESTAGSGDGRENDRPAAIANVYALANPVIWLAGLAAIITAAFHTIERREAATAIAVGAYLVFWAPWLTSPRIMFIYHYLPSLPFLYLALAWAIVELRIPRRYVALYLVAAAVAFAAMYPFTTAVEMPYALTPQGWAR